MAEIYDINDQPRITNTFTNLAGDATDPTAVTCNVKSPSGTTTVYTYGTDANLTKLETGVYALDLPLTESGCYKWKFNGTGALIASDQGRINVRRSLA